MALHYGRRDLKVGLQLTYPISNQDDTRRATLRISDENASIQIMEINLDADDLLALMSGSFTEVTAQVTRALHNVGKTMEHSQHVVSTTGVDDVLVTALAEEWRIKNGYDVTQVRRNNRAQWVITGRRWVDTDTTQEEK